MAITATYISANSFSVVGDQTSEFVIGRRVKLIGTGEWIGSITNSVYSSVTTVTVLLDSGSLDNSLTEAYYGIESPSESALMDHNHNTVGEGGQLDHVNLANKGTNTHGQIDSHLGSTSNPHSVDKSDVGLSAVPNTDFTSAVGSNTSHRTTTTGNPHSVTKSDVGLGNVANTDLTSAVGSNTSHRGTVTGNPHSVTKNDVGLGNVANTDFTSAVATNSAKVTFDSTSSTKVGYLTVTAATDLDTIRSNVSVNNAKVSYTDSAAVSSNTSHRTTTTGNPHSVTKADVGLSAVPNTDFTAAVGANTAKVTFDSTASTKVGHISVTQAVNLDTMESNIATNNAKVTNASHTGEVTGATALTIASNIVDEDNLKIANAPVNGYFLQAQSGQTGGLIWVSMASSNISDFASAVSGNSAVSANTAKISYTDASAVSSNTSHRTTTTGNPHSVTKADVGLGNVPNTDFTSAVGANTAKISYTDAAAVGLNTTHRGLTNNPHSVDKADVGLSNVPNTDFTSAVSANTAKVSYTDAAAVGLNTTHRTSDGKNHSDVVLNNTHRTTTSGNPHSVTKSDVGLSAVPNTDFTSAVAANTSKVSYSGVASDHGTATTAQIVNVVYGTGSAPTANTTTEGTIFIKYTA